MSRIRRLRIGRVVPVTVLVALLSTVMATSAFAATSVVKHRPASSVAGQYMAKKTQTRNKAKKPVAQIRVGRPWGPAGAQAIAGLTGANGLQGAKGAVGPQGLKG